MCKAAIVLVVVLSGLTLCFYACNVSKKLPTKLLYMQWNTEINRRFNAVFDRYITRYETILWKIRLISILKIEFENMFIIKLNVAQEYD